jgi:vancomycin resistance protein YoaR
MGHKINIDNSYNEIINVLRNEGKDYYIPLATDTIAPELSKDNIDELGIKEKIGTGESDFSGSTKNRKYNIEVATSRFHGLIIKPGEEFSFVKNLGEVDGDHGYKKELVIKKNTTVPEFGGGICQVSTTTFRAALNTGLEITERHNHAYPVSYYNPPGLDATIYIPSPDLKFINDTENNILIQTRIEGTKLFFDFYGTSDGRQVELEGPTITERTPDGKIRTVLYQKIKDENGNKLREDIFKSFYDNHDNYPNPNDIIKNKPKDWSGKQWEEYYAKYGNIIEQLNSQNL